MMENKAKAASRGQSRRGGGCGRAHSRVRLAAKRHEQRIEIGDGEARCRQGEPKDHDAEHAKQEGLALAAQRPAGRWQL
jgi:hypothetical protein